VLQKEEKQRLQVLQQLGTLKNERLRRQREQRRTKLAAYVKKKAREDAKHDKAMRSNRHELFRLEGLVRSDRESGRVRGGKGGGRRARKRARVEGDAD